MGLKEIKVQGMANVNGHTINRREFVRNLALAGAGVGMLGNAAFPAIAGGQSGDIRIGIVGLAVHSAAFSQLLNDPEKAADLAGCRVTALYHPPGNPDVDFTKEQLDKFEQDVREMGVAIVSSMEELLRQVDVVMIETNDGRPHLEQVMPTFRAGKPVFIDKPVAADLKGVVEIFDQAKAFQVPVFSSSSLRYLKSAQGVDRSQVLGAYTYSPAPTEKSHTELFWYGIHGVELLYTVMGTGCQEVMHVHHTDGEDVVVGFWNHNRVGTFRGIRQGRRDYGGTVFEKAANTPLGTFEGYRPLVVKVVEFFRSKRPPVPVQETLEIYAFMEAAQESRKRGGTKVRLEEVLGSL